MTLTPLQQSEDYASPWWKIEGLDCEISIEKRPLYCDRGNWIAKIHDKPGGKPLRLNLDEADGWPRYYFDWERMLLEIEAWLVKRKQILNGQVVRG